MGALCWMAVSLAVLLSAGNSAAVDQNKLAAIVHQICRNYRPSYYNQSGNSWKSPMYSLVVSMPFNEQTNNYEIDQVLNSDNRKQVIANMLACEVYVGSRVVGATVLKWPDVLDQCPDGRVQWSLDKNTCNQRVNTWADVKKLCPNAIREGTSDHAEYRTLQNLKNLINRNNKNDLYLIYVYASPCGSKCANADHTANILQFLEPFGKSKNGLFVFSKVFQPKGVSIPEAELKRALEEVGSKIGLDNIFRCDYNEGWTTCTSCSSGGDVTPQCYKNEDQPGPQSTG